MVRWGGGSGEGGERGGVMSWLDEGGRGGEEGGLCHG